MTKDTIVRIIDGEYKGRGGKIFASGPINSMLQINGVRGFRKVSNKCFEICPEKDIVRDRIRNIYFIRGERVRIIGGAYKNQYGTIAEVTDDYLFIQFDIGGLYRSCTISNILHIPEDDRPDISVDKNIERMTKENMDTYTAALKRTTTVKNEILVHILDGEYKGRGGKISSLGNRCSIVKVNGLSLPVSINNKDMKIVSDDTIMPEEIRITFRHARPKEADRVVANMTYGGMTYMPGIKEVIYNKPATIVFWNDDTKTVVKCPDGVEYDKWNGLTTAIVKRLYGNTHHYHDGMKKFMKERKGDKHGSKP